MKIVSCDILKRSDTGMFQSIASLPLLGQSKLCSIHNLLTDSGLSAFQRFDDQAAVVLSKVQRACSQAMDRIDCATASLQIKGSLQLKASLPGKSDIDAAIEVRSLLRGRENQSASLRLVQDGHLLQKIISNLNVSIDVVGI